MEKRRNWQVLGLENCIEGINPAHGVRQIELWEQVFPPLVYSTALPESPLLDCGCLVQRPEVYRSGIEPLDVMSDTALGSQPAPSKSQSGGFSQRWMF